MSIRDILVKQLTPQNKQRLQSVLLNVRRILGLRSRLSSSLSSKSLGNKSKFCFFGYYDISPFNDKGDVLFLQLDDVYSYADIMVYNKDNGKCCKLAESKAWNWQQGVRLRWYPHKDNRIIFNDFRDGRYIARIIDVLTNEEVTCPKPIYDIDCNGRYGLTLDFERLGVKRPGYGYTCKPYSEPKDLASEGIDLIDLTTNLSRRIITYNDISKAIGSCINDNFKNNYINHLSFSPSGKKFMFFWLTIVGDYHLAYMLVYDLKTETIIPLETERKVSHYMWLDENHLLCTVYSDKKECHYEIFGLDGSKKRVLHNINYDGHPIWYKDGLILTDSYPDRKGYQRLMVCNLDTAETKQILEVFHEPALSVERRTDLHPRYDSATDTICIDCNKTGKRELLLITQ